MNIDYSMLQTTNTSLSTHDTYEVSVMTFVYNYQLKQDENDPFNDKAKLSKNKN